MLELVMNQVCKQVDAERRRQGDVTGDGTCWARDTFPCPIMSAEAFLRTLEPPDRIELHERRHPRHRRPAVGPLQRPQRPRRRLPPRVNGPPVRHGADLPAVPRDRPGDRHRGSAPGRLPVGWPGGEIRSGPAASCKILLIHLGTHSPCRQARRRQRRLVRRQAREAVHPGGRERRAGLVWCCRTTCSSRAVSASRCARKIIMDKCNPHTIVRLPTGIFYARA